MATQAHCAFCFETLAASLDRRRELKLAQVEELWASYHALNSSAEEEEQRTEDDENIRHDEQASPKPAAISRLLNRGQSASSSSSSLSGSGSGSSSKDASRTATPASSLSSQSSQSPQHRQIPEEHPLFITWNTISRSGHKSLRGCIGTFEPQELEYGLKSYALTSAFEDGRFQPIPKSLLPSLACNVTLLTNFSSPSPDPFAWTLGKHGIRISFLLQGRRYGATYLPDVAKEQGWTVDETLISLMRKAGWNGREKDWEKVWKEGRGELITYEGKKVELRYQEWKVWRDWVDEQGVKSKPLN